MEFIFVGFVKKMPRSTVQRGKCLNCRYVGSAFTIFYEFIIFILNLKPGPWGQVRVNLLCRLFFNCSFSLLA